jgi:hypothetical protein
VRRQAAEGRDDGEVCLGLLTFGEVVARSRDVERAGEAVGEGRRLAREPLRLGKVLPETREIGLRPLAPSRAPPPRPPGEG